MALSSIRVGFLLGYALSGACLLVGQTRSVTDGVYSAAQAGRGQALYTAQALATNNAALREHFIQASAEETDHLAWTEQRLQELGVELESESEINSAFTPTPEEIEQARRIVAVFEANRDMNEFQIDRRTVGLAPYATSVT